MSVSQQDKVLDQFSPQANAYLTSAVHASGPDLLYARGLISTLTHRTQALDLGCGAGHLSFLMAPFFEKVAALDLSSAMLGEVTMEAKARGIDNISVHEASSHKLPFEEGVFDLVASRYSAHHWRDLKTALAEMRRVAKKGAHFLMIDIDGFDDALIDTHLQTIELLRDPSHLKDRTPLEWLHLLNEAGFCDIEHVEWPVRMEFKSWIARMNTPKAREEMIKTVLHEAPREVQAALLVEPDASFSMRTGLWWARVSP